MKLLTCFALALFSLTAATHAHHSGTGSRFGTRCSSCQRDSRGRIRRSTAARSAFRRANPCPATQKTTGACPGYVVDHIKALKSGGADEPANMQWQTREEAREKDRTE
jgi:hypothetical protein